MRWLGLLLCLSTAAMVWAQADFRLLYPKDYQKGLDFLQKNKSLFAQKAADYQLDAKILQAVIFPELMRYEETRDELESKGLEFAYVRVGAVVADFSIGYFQIKPSFVEGLERLCEQEKNRAWAKPFGKIYQFSSQEPQRRRQERHRRLRDLGWQLDYLCCFCRYVQGKFSAFLSKKDQWARLRFISTAYNAGFHRKAEDIERLQSYRCFPYGSLAPASEQFAYSEVALFFYKNNLK